MGPHLVFCPPWHTSRPRFSTIWANLVAIPHYSTIQAIQEILNDWRRTTIQDLNSEPMVLFKTWMAHPPKTFKHSTYSGNALVLWTYSHRGAEYGTLVCILCVLCYVLCTSKCANGTLLEMACSLMAPSRVHCTLAVLWEYFQMCGVQRGVREVHVKYTWEYIEYKIIRKEGNINREKKCIPALSCVPWVSVGVETRLRASPSGTSSSTSILSP
jgi:hypothetical protein